LEKPTNVEAASQTLAPEVQRNTATMLARGMLKGLKTSPQCTTVHDSQNIAAFFN